MASSMDIDASDQTASSAYSCGFEHPTRDYQFNICLVQLSREITDEDLAEMKYFILGDQGSPRGVLEKITTPLKLFDHLRGRCLLSRDNILFLQAMLYHARRIDLYKKLTEYGKERGDTLYCYPESDTPVNGYKFVRFHVSGTGRFDRQNLENIRAMASTYLNVPPYFVNVQGIKATQSFLITFMIPEVCVEAFSNFDSRGKQLFLSVGIDSILLESETFHLKESPSNEADTGIQLNEQLQYYFQRNKALQKQLEHYQLSELQNEIKTTSTVTTALTVIAVYLYNVMQNRKPDPLQALSNESVHSYFRHMIEKVANLGYDKDLIRLLLEANALIVRKNCVAEHQLLILQLHIENQVLRHSVRVVQYERDKLKYYIQRSIHEPVLSENEEFFLHFITKSIPIQIVIKAGTGVPFEYIRPYLKEASTHLTDQDKQKLRQAFSLPMKEERLLIQQKLSFIERLGYFLATGRDRLDLESFGEKIITTVNREEFENIWKSEMEKFFIKYELKKPEIQTPQSKGHSGKGRRDSKRLSKAEEKHTDKIDEVSDKVDLITRRLSQIESLILNPLARLDFNNIQDEEDSLNVMRQQFEGEQ